MKYILIVLLVALAAYAGYSFATGGFKASVSHSLNISAPPEKVWQVLTDYARYPEWNSTMVFKSHDFKVGNQVSFASLDSDGKETMTITPEVLDYTPNKAIVWKGSLFVPGIFDGTHQFYLEAQADGSTRFTQKEDFSGLLIPLTRNNVIKDAQARFILMDEELKREAEK